MGFWQATKNYLKRKVNEAGSAVANKVSDLSALSTNQLEEIEELRSKYFESQERDLYEIGSKILAANSVAISNAYLRQIKELYLPVQNVHDSDGKAGSKENHNIRNIRIKKWVTDKDENSLEKLINVYETLSQEDCTIGLIFDRKMEGTDVFLGVVNEKWVDNNTDADIFEKRLENSLKGNFPGTDFEYDKNVNVGAIPCLQNLGECSVATISNIPAEKSEKFISQTIEKLLDGSVPEKEEDEYTVVLLAKPIVDIDERKLFLQGLYSMFSPFASWQKSHTYSEGQNISSTANGGVNAGFSHSGTNGQVKDGDGGLGSIFGTIICGVAGGVAGFFIGGPAGVIAGVSAGAGAGGGLGNAIGHIIQGNVSSNESTSNGFNFGLNFSRSSSVSVNVGKGEGVTETFVNYPIQHMLKMLEYQSKRYDEGTALGMWDFAAYVVSKNHVVANNVAHSYLALTQGEESYVSQVAINLWRGDVDEEKEQAKVICSYLRQLRHPEFALSKELLEKNSEWSLYPLVTSATTSVSGKELSYALNFPQKSIAGMPVIQCAEFGRNISTYEDEGQAKCMVKIGKIFHMHKEEKNAVKLSRDSLASHVFVTGSTGVGKSNTVYKLLEEVTGSDNNVKFMVIEPAKGEYKDSLGKLDNVRVYGTNPRLMTILRINPFSFPKNIHVTEHIDRLVELFNVCWPMYAAMPAVLKDAVERAYKDCGWDLATSKNEHGGCFYPSFRDVVDNVKKIIDESDYDVLNKGAYKGALITRLQSLTNGINGLIFVSDELSDNELFEQNVIVDLSRIGAQETKALIMGMMVLKLQEYHLDKMDNDSNLKHITVLEEAHNLLKRSAIGGIEEGGNLQGKSVEMISNAIAEMRTYGEGFVIVDQAPGLLDMAAIRNTNTKIILRLPDLSDRELVGWAANLNDDQVNELARLPRGVAAIYHNEWIEPVLCKVAKFENSQKCDYRPNDSKRDLGNKENALEIVELLEKCERLSVEELEIIKVKMHNAKIRASVQVKILALLKNPFSPLRMRQIAPIVSELYSDLYEKVKLSYLKSTEPMEWTRDADAELRNIYANNIDEKMRRIILHGLLLQYLCYEVKCEDDLQRWVEGRFVR